MQAISLVSSMYACCWKSEALHEDAVSVCTGLQFTKIRGDPLYTSCLDNEKGLHYCSLTSEGVKCLY